MKVIIEAEDMAKYVTISIIGVYNSVGFTLTKELVKEMKDGVYNDIVLANSIPKSVKMFNDNFQL